MLLHSVSCKPTGLYPLPHHGVCRFAGIWHQVVDIQPGVDHVRKIFVLADDRIFPQVLGVGVTFIAKRAKSTGKKQGRRQPGRRHIQWRDGLAAFAMLKIVFKIPADTVCFQKVAPTHGLSRGMPQSVIKAWVDQDLPFDR